MNRAKLQLKVSQRVPAVAVRDDYSEKNGISIVPPAYGINAIDRQSEGMARRKKNKTGIPDGLKAGVELISGVDMSDVRVHYNSREPSYLEALAYTQGTNIHVGPGQEQHLAHEAWHVVQQKQGRVKPTIQIRETAINDDIALEREAEEMARVAKGRGQEWTSEGHVPAVTRVEGGSCPGATGDVVQRFGVAIRPRYVDRVGWVIDRVVIDGRPPGPRAADQPQHGGGSFHHETAWFIDEYNIARRWEGQTIENAYENLQREDRVPPLPRPRDLMRMQAILNNYFDDALRQAAANAPGFFGSAGAHAAQGGDINAKIQDLRRAVQEQDFDKLRRAAFYIYLSTYEENPGLPPNPFFLRTPRQRHVDKITNFLWNYGLDETEIEPARAIIMEHWGLRRERRE